MTTTASNPAQAERAALSDLFVEVGPDAPTLCGDWTTRDLAAHLVMRERRPDGAVGILVSRAAGYTDKVQQSIADGDWSELVESVRSGPPFWSPTRIAAVDKMVNTVEFFVHHEDVRRAGETWEPRVLDADLLDGLYSVLSKMGKQLTKSSPIGIVLEPTDGHAPLTVNKASPSVRIRGELGELVLYVYGRQRVSNVELFGDDASIAELNNASLGI